MKYIFSGHLADQPFSINIIWDLPGMLIGSIKKHISSSITFSSKPYLLFQIGCI